MSFMDLVNEMNVGNFVSSKVPPTATVDSVEKTPARRGQKRDHGTSHAATGVRAKMPKPAKPCVQVTPRASMPGSTDPKCATYKFQGHVYSLLFMHRPSTVILGRLQRGDQLRAAFVLAPLRVAMPLPTQARKGPLALTHPWAGGKISPARAQMRNVLKAEAQPRLSYPWPPKRDMPKATTLTAWHASWYRAVKFVRASGREDHGFEITTGPLAGWVCNEELLQLVKAKVSWTAATKSNGVMFRLKTDRLRLQECSRSTSSEEAAISVTQIAPSGRHPPCALPRLRGCAENPGTQRLHARDSIDGIRGRNLLFEHLQHEVERAHAPEPDSVLLVRMALGHSARVRGDTLEPSPDSERGRLLLCNGQEKEIVSWKQAAICRCGLRLADGSGLPKAHTQRAAKCPLRVKMHAE